MPVVTARGRPEVLLCPGPVLLSPGVKAALAQCEVGHRDARFSRVVARLCQNCATVLGATADHSVMFVTGPATSGIEATFATLFPPDRAVLVPVNGTFGLRLVEILEIHGIPCVPIHFGFGQSYTLERIEAAIVEGNRAGVAALAMTHHETSAGILNPIAEVCALARRHGLRTFVDATSSAGAEALDVARDGVGACVTTSGKCLHGAPGVALVCVSREWLGERCGSRPRTYSLDLRRYHDQLETNSQTPFTPAVPQFMALDRAVEELLHRGGIAARRREYRRRRGFLATAMEALGLSLLSLPHETEASSILTVRVPDSLGFDALYRAMQERGYVIYGAKPPLALDYFQLSIMGELSDGDLSGFVESLRAVLAQTAGPYRAASA